MILLPFANYWSIYLLFNPFVLVLLALDRGLNQKSHEVSLSEASIWTTICVGLALVFNFFFYKDALWWFLRISPFLRFTNIES